MFLKVRRRSPLNQRPRRIPRQPRGRRRVSQLLDAAAAVISSVGYDAATMTAIAAKAGAPIGSLYQFFPNKEAITHSGRAAEGGVIGCRRPAVAKRNEPPFCRSAVTAAEAGGSRISARAARLLSRAPQDESQRQTPMKIECFSFVAFAIGALALEGCSSTSASSATAPPPPEVLVSTVVQKDVSIYGDWVATLDGYVNANIQPQVSGYLIE